MDNLFEENDLNEEQLPQKECYGQRPAWQVWCARIGLVLFLIVVLFQLLSIARGGL